MSDLIRFTPPNSTLRIRAQSAAGARVTVNLSTAPLQIKTGVVGPQGPKGDTGLVGPKGERGPAGAGGASWDETDW